MGEEGQGVSRARQDLPEGPPGPTGDLMEVLPPPAWSPPQAWSAKSEHPRPQAFHFPRRAPPRDHGLSRSSPGGSQDLTQGGRPWPPPLPWHGGKGGGRHHPVHGRAQERPSGGAGLPPAPVVQGASLLPWKRPSRFQSSFAVPDQEDPLHLEILREADLHRPEQVHILFSAPPGRAWGNVVVDLQGPHGQPAPVPGPQGEL